VSVRRRTYRCGSATLTSAGTWPPLVIRLEEDQRPARVHDYITYAALICLATLIAFPCASAATFQGRVAHTVDGDTLDVVAKRKRIRVPILDIDAPEHGQPYGHRSR